MNGFEKQLEVYRRALEQALPGFLPDTGTPQESVRNAMAYSLLSGGKRIRAVLLLATYDVLAGEFHAAIPYASAVEMLHAYSLIHDDLPCMDDDDMRRGKPSCHIKFGEATALLAGDGLLTLAFETMSQRRNENIFGAGKALSCIRALSAAAGANGMVGGQMIDLENEKRNVTVKDLTLSDSKKTGALIRAACEIGCILGGADERVTEHVLGYAGKIGLAFQVIDDILDVTADEKLLGKPIGSDNENHRATYVSLCGIDKAKEIAAKLTDEAVHELNRTGIDAVFLCEFARTLAARTH